MESLNNDAIAPSKSCLSYDTEILTLEHGVLSIFFNTPFINQFQQ